CRGGRAQLAQLPVRAAGDTRVAAGGAAPALRVGAGQCGGLAAAPAAVPADNRAGSGPGAAVPGRLGHAVGLDVLHHSQVWLGAQAHQLLAGGG
nr:hypothetical protein [Tanacetum cinerariifolium]